MSIRIEDIQKVTVNGKKRKLFRVYKEQEKERGFAYVGTYSAPNWVADKDLIAYYEHGEDNR